MASSSGDSNPRQAEIERALALSQERADAGRIPRRRRYHRIVGAAAGTHQHARRKRNQQRRLAFNWRARA